MATETRTTTRAPNAIHQDTHFARRPVINPTRAHDYLYDSHYVTSSERDHARATLNAHTNVSRVKRVPVYDHMFSVLRHKPRFTVQLQAKDPVPEFVNRQWPGYADQARENIIRYKTFNYDPSVKIPPKVFPNQMIDGSNRHKYFTRPIIPYLQTIPPEVILASARQDAPLHGGPTQSDSDTSMAGHAPVSRSVGQQTDYRDGEVQTDPYSPDYVVKPGVQPELLTLATLSYGCGLPAGLAEVEMIERARAKRAWEATLPPLADIEQHDKRKRMMEDMELVEWELREKEIEKLQQARLSMLKQLLRQREENHCEINMKRIDKLWTRKQELKEEKVKQIRNKHIKELRKIASDRKHIEGISKKRDIVKEYSDYGSEVYAPSARVGVFMDRGSEQYVVHSQYVDNYFGLLELENSIPSFILHPSVRAPKQKLPNKNNYVNRKQRREKELADIYNLLKEKKLKGEEQPKPLRFLQKIEKPIPRPPTPSVKIPNQLEEEKELAIIHLQSMIRGRAIQNMMYEGKEKRMELIEELRSTHALEQTERDLKLEQQLSTKALQRQRQLHERKEDVVVSALVELEGKNMGDMLQFLNKELIRLQEERRVHAFAMLANRQRRIREAEESGKRQMEERRRREQDEIFKQVTKVHQTSVNTYLEDVIMKTMNNVANEQSRKEIRKMADKINDVSHEIERNRTQLESQEIVSELVHEFLIPECEKKYHREKIQQCQRRHLMAVHNELYDNKQQMISQHSKRPSSKKVVIMDKVAGEEDADEEEEDNDGGDDDEEEEEEEVLDAADAGNQASQELFGSSLPDNDQETQEALAAKRDQLIQKLEDTSPTIRDHVMKDVIDGNETLDFDAVHDSASVTGRVNHILSSDMCPGKDGDILEDIMTFIEDRQEKRKDVTGSRRNNQHADAPSAYINKAVGEVGHTSGGAGAANSGRPHSPALTDILDEVARGIQLKDIPDDIGSFSGDESDYSN